MAANWEQGHEMTNPQFPGEYRYYYKGNALTLDDYVRSAGTRPPRVSGAPATAAPGGVDLRNDPDYRKKQMGTLGQLAARRIDKADEGFNTGLDMVDSADQADALLDAGTPTGFGGTMQAGLGKALGGVLGGVGPIPTKAQTDNMLMLRRMGGKSLLQDVQFMKGALSNSDREFLASLQYSIGQTPGYNRKVAEAQRWAGKKATAYGAAMRAWTDKLGSPDARNANGLSFPLWWAQWSREKLPPPGVEAPSQRAAQNAQLKAKSSQAPLIERARKTGQAQIIGIE